MTPAVPVSFTCPAGLSDMLSQVLVGYAVDIKNDNAST
jgi:hypothetical protein